METGPTGMTGATAPSRVVAECRKDQELVPIPHHNLEEIHVLGKARRPVLVMKTLAQVPDSQTIYVVFNLYWISEYNCGDFGRYTRQTIEILLQFGQWHQKEIMLRINKKIHCYLLRIFIARF